MDMKDPEMEIVRASQLRERVVQRIAEIRDPEPFATYKTELRRYKRRLGKKTEVTRAKRTMLGDREERGFWALAYGQDVFVARPERPSPAAYHYLAYNRSTYFTAHAKIVGLLADPRYNRDLRPERVAQYEEAMRQGEWRDLLSDPIAITEEGDVLNGQHRIAASVRVDWSEAENDPMFLVVWNADPQEARYADGSRRTPRDQGTVAVRLADRAQNDEQEDAGE
jgi:hypothetical protein